MQKRKIKIRLRNVLPLLAILVLGINLISSQFELMSKKQQYESLCIQEQRLEIEVRALQHLLDEEDEATYMERIARQRLGYANPSEKIFIDINAD